MYEMRDCERKTVKIECTIHIQFDARSPSAESINRVIHTHCHRKIKRSFSPHRVAEAHPRCVSRYRHGRRRPHPATAMDENLEHELTEDNGGNRTIVDDAGDQAPTTSPRTATGRDEVADQCKATSAAATSALVVAAGHEPEEPSEGGSRTLTDRHERSAVLPYRDHARAVFSLTVPIVLSQLFQHTLPLVDLAFVGNLGKDELAAAALATVWFNLWNSAMLGFLTSVYTLLSQSYGAGDYHAFAVWTGNSLVIVPACTAALAGAVALCGPAMRLLGQDPDLADMAGQFSYRLIPGLFPYYLFLVVLTFLQTQDRPVPGVVVGILANGMNVFFNWLLIFAAGMGLQGAPWATSLTRFLEFLMIVAYVVWVRPSFRCPVSCGAPPPCEETTRSTISCRGDASESKSAPDDDEDDDDEDGDEDGDGTVLVTTWPQFDATCMTRDALRPFWKLAVSGGMSFAAETWSFEVTTILAGLLGTTALDAHAITLTLATFLYLSFPFAIGVAASIRVGQLTGDSRPEDAERSYVTSTALAAVTQGVLIAVLWPCRNVIGAWFSNDEDVVALVAELIPISCVFMMADAVEGTVGGVLRGLGRQKAALYLNILAYWVLALPIGSALTFPAGMGVQGLWWGFVIGMYVSALIILLYVRFRINWQAEAKKALLRISTVSAVFLQGRESRNEERVAPAGDALPSVQEEGTVESGIATKV